MKTWINGKISPNNARVKSYICGTKWKNKLTLLISPNSAIIPGLVLRKEQKVIRERNSLLDEFEANPTLGDEWYG